MDKDEGRLPDIAVRVGIYFQTVAGRNILDRLRHCWGVWNGLIWDREERERDASLYVTSSFARAGRRWNFDFGPIYTAQRLPRLQGGRVRRAENGRSNIYLLGSKEDVG